MSRVFSWCRHGLRALLLVTLAQAPCVLPAVAATAETVPASLGGLRDFMDMMHAAEVDLATPPTATPSMREWLALVRAEVPSERYYAMAVPAVARYLSPAEIDALGRLAHNPLVRRDAQREYARTHGGPAPQDGFTAAEQAELRRLLQPPLPAHYAQARRQSAPEIRERLKAVTTELSQRLWKRAQDEAARRIAALDPDKPGSDGPAHRLGVSFMDRYVDVLVDGQARRLKLWRAYREEATRIGVLDKLRGARVLAPQGDSAALGAVQAVEFELEVTLRRATELDEATANALRQIPFPDPQLAAQMAENQLTADYASSILDAELAHRRMALYRRLVALLKGHEQRIRLEGEQLVFQDDDVLAQFRQMWADIAAMQGQSVQPGSAPAAAPPPDARG